MIRNKADTIGVDFNVPDNGIRYPAQKGAQYMKATKENISNQDFTADKDYFETLEDGRRIQVLAKGVTVSRGEAIELGVIKSPGKTEAKPEETGEKSLAPAENKKTKPAENKSKGGTKDGD